MTVQSEDSPISVQTVSVYTCVQVVTASYTLNQYPRGVMPMKRRHATAIKSNDDDAVPNDSAIPEVRTILVSLVRPDVK